MDLQLPGLQRRPSQLVDARGMPRRSPRLGPMREVKQPVDAPPGAPSTPS